MSSTGARPSASSTLARAIRNATARGAARPFRWSSFQGMLVMALACGAASTSLVRRRETEEKLEIADLRVARAEAKADAARQALVSTVPDAAGKLAAVRTAKDREQVLRRWIEECAAEAEREEPRKKADMI